MTQTVLLKDALSINPTIRLKKGQSSVFVSMDKLDPFKRKISGQEIREYGGGSKFMNNDTLLARITPCLENGKTAYVDVLEENEVGAGSTEFIVLRAKEGVTEPDFIYYLSISPEFRKYAIQAMSGTSGRQRVQVDVLSGYEFQLPNIKSQKKTGLQLRNIDEKIELNRQVNKTLERIGQTLFRHYFLDHYGIKTARHERVGDFVEHVRTGISPAKAPETLFAQYSIPAFDNSMSPEITRGVDIKSNKYQVMNKSILVSKLNPATPRIWTVMKAMDNAICSTEFQVLIPEKWLGFTYFLLTSREYTEKMAMSAGGTSNSHRRVGPNDILNYTFAGPDKTLLRKFEEIANGLLLKIEENRQETQTLTALRDTLLPRLISEKIKV